MNNQIKDKLEKVLALVEKGNAGEKQAAENALSRLMKKYNVSEHELANIKLRLYKFKYKSNLDLYLFTQLLAYFFPEKNFEVFRNTQNGKDIEIYMEYLEWVTLETAWGYFRPHMAKQWRIFSQDELKRKRSTRTRNKRRQELYLIFFNIYIQKSKLYHPEQLSQREDKMSLQERNDTYNAQMNITGGNYKKQVNRGLYLK